MTIQAFTIRLCFVLAYLVLALPLPSALLDHELGLLSGDPAHTVLDDHAWPDHAAGAGGVSEESAFCAPEVNASAVVPTDDRTPEEVADAVLDALGLKEEQ